MKKPRRKRKLILAGIVATPILFLALWAFVIEPSRLIIHEKTIAMSAWPSGLNGLKIAAISDIHAGSPFIDADKLRLIVERTNETRPDVIVLLGDYMVRDTWHSTEIAPEVIAEALNKLRAPLGVYAVLGNHDWWYDLTRVRTALELNGIRVIDNDVVRLEKNGLPFWLVGIADAWSGTDDIAGTASRVPAGEPAIAATHNPDILPRFPPAFLLTLGGHTHGGQGIFRFSDAASCLLCLVSDTQRDTLKKRGSTCSSPPGLALVSFQCDFACHLKSPC